ncbi:VOC family protein [Sediminibacterium goheungense]|uniref:Glyoxalase/bleomycin resistance protein/dioxygenase superfamily protein n=1 Tax=Sediminibacterium goheungense TaxID=1086393 RepID=A0A4R6IV73_9BACT|nr:VOC family protein [Sediminibacterium goheungense]TDO26247.1 glyoxalase/bleomycin resistance protein/dioxygenase superfamily protein [Sediminibacterium goheungense]
MKSISPNIFVKDIHATINFYTKLGFTVSDEVTTPEGEKIFALMTNGTVVFMFQTFASIEDKLPMVSRADGGSLLMYISVENIRQYYDTIKEQVTLLTGLEKTFYGATEFSLCDNNNYLLTFAEHD